MNISDGVDIAAYSMKNAQTSLMQSVGTSILSKSMDIQETQGAQLTQMMEQSVNPAVGGNIDITL